MVLSMKTTKDEVLTRFWSTLDTLLMKEGRTLLDMAEATGIKYQTLIGWRTNKRLPDLYSALLIADFMAIPLEALCLADGLGKVAKESTAGIIRRVAPAPATEEREDRIEEAMASSEELCASLNAVLAEYLGNR